MLGWMELPQEDRPPQHIWLDDDALADHFERVRERWKNPGRTTESVPEADLEQNELTRHIRRG